MKSSGKQASLREAVGVFTDTEHLKAAAEDLLAAGFARDQLGLLASEYAVQQKLGDAYTRIKQTPDTANAHEAIFVENRSAEDTTHALAGGLYFVGGTAALGALVASSAVLGGPLVVAIAAAAGVGAVGALVGSIIRKSEADYLREQIDEGHVLLFVRDLGDAPTEENASRILARHSALSVKIYEVPAKPE